MQQPFYIDASNHMKGRDFCLILGSVINNKYTMYFYRIYKVVIYVQYMVIDEAGHSNLG